VFYAEYVDLWSYCPPDRFLRDHGLIQMFGDRYELLCFPLPFAPDVVKQLNKIRTRGQWEEDRLFAALTLFASLSWDALVDEAVLVFLRRVVGGAVDDHEITESLCAIPGWMAPSTDKR
jgi:hypothetical protein